METDATQAWEAYRERLLAKLRPVLASLRYTLDDEQPHTQGERHVIQAVGGGRKLVLLGRAADGMSVVVKAADEPEGVREIEHERACRAILERIHFAYGAFSAPAELFFGKRDGLTLSVTEFIEQDQPFLGRTIEDQFGIALAAFKAQESAHATTAAHRAWVARTFGEIDAAQYCANARAYARDIGSENPAFARAATLLCEHAETLDRYGSFLTHWDFLPQNFRIRDGKLYLLDQSSLRFGNKYEGWARFVNFMELYNPALARAFVRYVADNRTPEETLSLKLMRAYRLLELVLHHALLLPRTSGNLHALSAARIAFWTTVLECVLDDRNVPEATVEAYKAKRDALRSDDEKARQKNLH
ncbi:MAG: hypothetical protein KGI41_02795 [Patescibacteria group bacterium]|nr:hypothetical protein [Patescibacteria group bacterium]MDE1966142.1 hypothetical protein [Patescibacteria group bacterium]